MKPAMAGGVRMPIIEHVLHIRTGDDWFGCIFAGAQLLQKISPQFRQWCRRRIMLNFNRQPAQCVRSSSSIQCSPVGVRRRSRPTPTKRGASGSLAAKRSRAPPRGLELVLIVMGERLTAACCLMTAALLSFDVFCLCTRGSRAEGLAEVGYAPGKSANLDPVRVDPLPSALASGLNLGPQRGSHDRY